MVTLVVNAGFKGHTAEAKNKTNVLSTETRQTIKSTLCEGLPHLRTLALQDLIFRKLMESVIVGMVPLASNILPKALTKKETTHNGVSNCSHRVSAQNITNHLMKSKL